MSNFAVMVVGNIRESSGIRMSATLSFVKEAGSLEEAKGWAATEFLKANPGFAIDVLNGMPVWGIAPKAEASASTGLR